MATQAATKVKPTMLEPVPQAIGRVIPGPFVLAVTSGLLLWLSFPPAEWSWAAWFALTPLFLLIKSTKGSARIYFASWLGGFGFWMLAIQWIWATDPSAWVGWIAMAFFLSLWWPSFLFLARFSTRRLSLPVMVSAPLFWVGLEYTRAYVLTGFPWYYLAHSQYRLPYFTQIADFSGALGLSMVVALANAYWVEILTTPFLKIRPGASLWSRIPLVQKARMVVMLFVVGGTVAYGVFRVHTASFRPGPRIAMIQTGEVQEYDSDKTKSPEQLRALLGSMADRAARAMPRPDLIVWPETSFPDGYVLIEPKIDPKFLEELAKQTFPGWTAADWIHLRSSLNRHFDQWVEATKVPMIVGTTTYDFRTSGYSKYNSAVLFQPGSVVQIYHKMHLVPFGEYVPLVDALPWLIRLTPYRGTRRKWLDPSTQPAWFNLGAYRLAVAICFEDTVPQVVRRSFSEAPDGRQPDVLINLSNDGWFHETSEHEMHLAVSTFRCIENRVPLARAVNTGISAVVDGNGRIVKSLSKTTVDVLVDVIPLDDRVSLYTRWGDWLGRSCLASTVGLLLMGTFKPRRSKNRVVPA